MITGRGSSIFQIQTATQALAMAVLVGGAIGLSLATFLAAVGAVPWINIQVGLGGEPVEAGRLIQLGATLLLLALSAYLPAAHRVLKLEAAHREFEVGMEDVARAYYVAHAADRRGVFLLDREFDAVRERYKFLRDHPDLASLTPELLEMAAQMSVEARDLAEIYSDEKVTRAREMLAHRQTEAAELEAKIEEALQVSQELRRVLAGVEMEEDMVRARLSRLRGDLAEIMAEIEARSGVSLKGPKRANLRVAPAE